MSSEIHKKKLVVSSSEVAEMADGLRHQEMIGVDTEFIRENTFYPKMALIQIATRERAWLVDPTVLSKEALAPLFECLSDKRVLKIMHAAHSDQECFLTAYGFLVAPVLDTAVAAALIGMGDNLGLSRLLKDILDINLPKGRARARWLTRPLPQELLDYAEKDVLHLVDLTLWLKSELEKLDRWEWALQESLPNRAVLEVTPDDMAQKMAKSGQLEPGSFGCLLELFRWREQRARDADLPRAWVADNETIVALAKSKPHSIDELKHFRGLNHREVEKQGKNILAAIESGKKLPKPNWPRPKRLFDKNDDEEHVLDLIQSYVAFLAAGHRIATRFLLSSQKAPLLFAHSESDPNSWVEEGILSPFAAKLIGDDLKALLSGRRALAIENRRVKVVKS